MSDNDWGNLSLEYPTCPYCGADVEIVVREYTQWDLDDICDFECYKCDKYFEFRVRRMVESRRVGNDVN